MRSPDAPPDPNSPFAASPDSPVQSIWFTQNSTDHSLHFARGGEQVTLTPWGPNAYRVQASVSSTIPSESWGLTEPIALAKASISIDDINHTARCQNGNLGVTVSSTGKLVFSNLSTGKVVLEEFVRQRDMTNLTDPKCSLLKFDAREFLPKAGTDAWHLTARFESLDEDERIYGMGQYQHTFLNLKGVDMELAQRNSQASVPFAVSSLGYGFLWNNPGVGRAVYAKTGTTFEAFSTKGLDYWVVVGDTPKEIVRAYMGVTGKPPMMPEYGLGFWQCKLRYQTQEELLGVAREYKRRKLPIDVIVCDYFHWEKEGEWKFDPTFWPDPDAMIRELESMDIKLMVSIWPTVQRTSENFDFMSHNSLLVKQDRGWPLSLAGPGNTIHFDATNPKARSFVWSRVKKNYFDKGIRLFWLDEAEPEFTFYQWDNYRFAAGPQMMIGNVFPREYARAFYEGMRTETKDAPMVSLVRCAWIGSARYACLLWSGDIASSWLSFRSQLQAGLNVGIAGVPWWTTDIGGFHGGDPKSPEFRELFIRWFQWGAFCPVMRLHGDRIPKKPRLGTTGGSFCLSGQDNEVWSFGEEVYEVCKVYLVLRERLREYVRGLMREAKDQGDPLMRAMFYEFPDDATCWTIGDQYMFGSKYLVAPVLYPGLKKREVYLPAGSWRAFKPTGDVGGVVDGGRKVTVGCPIEAMPVFERVE